MDLTKQARRTILIGVVLSAVTLAVFWPVTGHNFISCDDPSYITLNARVLHGLNWANVGWACTTGSQGNWHPLTWLSHMLDVQLFGVKAGGHHLTSLLLHVANALLLFLLLQRMTGAPWRSAAVAALFALHPLHVESVAWVAERKDVLSAFFFMLTLWAYARYAEGQSLKAKVQSLEAGVRSEESGVRSQNLGAHITPHAAGHTHPASRYYALSLLFFALGLMSKPMLVTLPFVLLLLDYWPLRRLSFPSLQYSNTPSLQHSNTPPLRLVLEKLPFLALSAASCVVTFLAQSNAGAVSSLAIIPLAQRASNALLAYATYLGQTFWPDGLAIFYPLPGQLPLDTLAPAAVVLLGLTAWAVSCARRSPHLAVGWFWFLGMLVPVIGLVQAGAQQMADRYTYLPLIGVFLMVVWEMTERLGASPQGRAALAAAAGGVLLACAALTSRQISWWQDTDRLFHHALDVTQNNYLAHNNLASDLLARGKPDEAIEHYQASLAMRPDQPHQLELRQFLGETLSKRGRYAEAAEQFSEVLRLQPNDVPALVQLGIARARQGKPDEAVQALAEALRLQPNDAGAHNSLGNVLAQQGQHLEAVRQFEEALRLKPGHAAALNNLALSCKKLGRLSEAIAHYREALRWQPDSLEALNNLAWILAAQPEARFRRGAEAVELATRACELTQYRNPVPLATLAAACVEAGKFPEAISLAEQAQALTAGSDSPLAARLRAMLAAFHAGQPYHAD